MTDKPKLRRVQRRAPVACSVLVAGFRHRLYYEFREGASMRTLARRYALTDRMIEHVIREHMTPNIGIDVHTTK